jgi:putative spermidine/putrescine transport system substrate-binding protein
MSIAAAILAVFTATPTFAESLTVVSWGGAYTRSQVEAYHKPFIAETGIEIESVDYNGGLNEIRTQVASNNVVWDVVDVELSDAIRGCEEGILEKIPASILPAGGNNMAVADDFVPDALQECAVGEVVWATVVAFDATKFPESKPRSIADFFDVARFPGKRGLRKSPRVNLEWAVMALGVPTDLVYDVLSTPEGLDRAFKKLDEIRPHAVWWEAGSEPPKMLDNGEVALTSVYNGRMFDPIFKEGKPYVINWDGQVWDLDLWAIPKGTKNLQKALDFVAFSTGTERLADQANYISYGPARRTSMDLISPFMKYLLPTSYENSRNALQNDFEWWAEHQEEMDRRFAAWFAGG